ncbi:MAG: arginase [Bacteroidetes bacterium]|nr:MAG: arginase [Bacteroidota bacterium]MBL1145940.1 arginase [Bacteroidota bacterium]MCB0802657.1 formimidoylglutamase [Flavobacteriales bacterium]NOG58734.1 formimidoylglutamase [Bacteroidota bacterium]
MEIADFFQPVDLERIALGKVYQERQLGSKIVFSPESLDHIDLAIFSVHDDRGSATNKGSANGANLVREYLYDLMQGNYSVKIADLGSIQPGESITDTYFAVQESVNYLIKNKVIPIIIGGSKDLTYANYAAYSKQEQTVNIVSVDSKFSLGNTDDVINAHNYLSKILFHQPNILFNYSNIGYQTYFIDQTELSLIEELFFDIYRLGLIKSNIQIAEPIIRNADMISFSMDAISQVHAPANKNASPNGFNGEQACQMARYAGMSDKLSSIGFYEFNPLVNDNDQTAHLLAQMLWYFVDGFYNRKQDFPACNKNEYIKYTVAIDDGEQELTFYKSPKSDRWWMDVPYHHNYRKKYERHLMLPCSYADYLIATENEIPERWFQTFKKLK